MTASSVEFFPCRVQLMGLPRSAGSTAAAATGAAPTSSALQQTPPRRPPMEKVQGVSRNLFGSPEPGEINHLYEQEQRRQHSYVFQRYNIDMKLLRTSSVTQQKLPTTLLAAKRQEQPTQQYQLPTLIARELKQHQQCLRKEECNLNRPNETTPPNAKIQQLQSCGGVSKIVRRCCADEALTPPSSTSSSASSSPSPLPLFGSVERQKPYARQSLLTESFNLRKNKICGPVSASSAAPAISSSQRQPLSANAENLSLESSLPDTHRNLQVLQMPQAMQAEMTLIDTSNTTTTTTTSTSTSTSTPTPTVTSTTTPDSHLDHNDVNDAEDDDDDDEDEDEQNDDCTSSSAESSPRLSSSNTTFSLKLLVSTQNAVATTTSSASREHTHHA